MTITTERLTIDIDASDVQPGSIVLTITVGTYTFPVVLNAEHAAVFAAKFATACATAFGDSVAAAMRQLSKGK